MFGKVSWMLVVVEVGVGLLCCNRISWWLMLVVVEIRRESGSSCDNRLSQI